jgi:hypothetical protein
MAISLAFAKASAGNLRGMEAARLRAMRFAGHPPREGLVRRSFCEGGWLAEP